jgi:hypothetical protein
MYTIAGAARALECVHGVRREEGCIQSLVGKLEGKRPLGRPRLRWEDDIKMDLHEVGCGAWIGLIWLRIGIGDGSCKSGDEPSGSIRCGEFLE